VGFSLFSLNIGKGMPYRTSIASALTWTLSLLLSNQHVLRKAQDKLNIHVVKDRHPDESDIKNFYLQAIVKETLRLYTHQPQSLAFVPQWKTALSHLDITFPPARV
jgi:hypothetical protein